MKPIIEVKALSKRYKLGVFNAKTLREEAEAFLARFKRRKAELAVGSRQSSVNSSQVTRHSSHAEPSSDFWALRDVSFDVQPGEVIGVIGRNGAGTQAANVAARETVVGSPKGETPAARINSTLLKILSRITEPKSGEARIRGRVASLLEVGTGFHRELSGREPKAQPKIGRRGDQLIPEGGARRQTGCRPACKGEPQMLASQNIFLNGAILGMSKQEIRNKFDEIAAFAEIEKFIDTTVWNYRWTGCFDGTNCVL